MFKISLFHNKLKATFLVIFLFFASPVFSATKLQRIPVNNVDMVGYWTMDGKDINWSAGTIQDKSAFGTIGYLQNMSTTSSPQIGKIGQALKLVNGNNSYIDTQDFGVPDMTGPYTISAWIYPYSWGGNSQGYVFRTDNYTLSISSAFARLRLDSPDSSFALSNNSTIALNTWQHVVAVYNGSGTVTLYINGVDQTADNTMTESGSGGWVYISDNTGGNSFDGLIDDVRTYGRALSAREVRELYNFGSTKLGVSKNPNLIKGLAGWWTFDGADLNWNTLRIIDKSINANNGDLGGFSTTTSVQMGKIGQSLKFYESVSNYVLIDSSATLNNLSALTISTWVKPTSNGGSGNRIITKLGGANPGWDLILNDQSTLQFDVSYDTTDLVIIFNQSNMIPLNQWTNIVLTWDGSSTATNAKLYINGTQVTNTSFTQNGVTSRRDDSGAQVTIGARSDTGGPRFDGLIDDLRIYNRVLSASEAKQLYNVGISKINNSDVISGRPIQSGLVGYWTMDGKDVSWSSGAIIDRSLSGNTAYLINMSTTTAAAVGKIGQALNFDGSNDRVYLGSLLNTLQNASGMTASLWIKWNTTPPNSTGIVQFSTNNGGVVSQTSRLDFSVDTTGTKWHCGGRAPDSDPQQSVETSTGTITPNVWYYATCVIDVANDTAVIYINGVAQAVTGTVAFTNTATDNTTSAGASIGSEDDGTARFAPAIFDDVKVYNRALSASEVKLLYNMSK